MIFDLILYHFKCHSSENGILSFTHVLVYGNMCNFIESS